MRRLHRPTALRRVVSPTITCGCSPRVTATLVSQIPLKIPGIFGAYSGNDHHIEHLILHGRDRPAPKRQLRIG